MGALLKQVNYSRAIIAGNALHFGQILRFLPIRSEFPIDDFRQSQWELWIQFRWNFRNHVAVSCFSPSYANINPTNYSKCNDDNEF